MIAVNHTHEPQRRHASFGREINLNPNDPSSLFEVALHWSKTLEHYQPALSCEKRGFKKEKEEKQKG